MSNAAQPHNPYTHQVYLRSRAAKDLYCWCSSVLDAQDHWMLGLDLIAVWKDRRNRRRVLYIRCAYCKATDAESAVDSLAYRRWLGDSLPGDHRVEPSSHGYCEHGLDGPHQHCVESGWRGGA